MATYETNPCRTLRHLAPRTSALIMLLRTFNQLGMTRRGPRVNYTRGLSTIGIKYNTGYCGCHRERPHRATLGPSYAWPSRQGPRVSAQHC